MTPPVRAIAPDLARGLMLLLIAVANVPHYLYGSDAGTVFAHHTGSTGVDLVWQVVSIIAIDGRSYPLFAFLFGYGIWQLYARQVASGTEPREARRLLQRRHAWMIAFGAVHALLLWMGDIVGAYGLIGLIVTWLFLDRKDRTLKIWVIVLLSLMALGSIFSLFGGAMNAIFGGTEDEIAGFALFENASAIASYPESMLARFAFWAIVLFGQAILSGAVPAMVLLAILAARHRILEAPAAHARLLRGVALWGLLIGWLGGGVTALGWLGVIALPDWAFSQWHYFTGVAAALGYAAVFALLAERIQRRGAGVITRALTALGARSLSGYLAQSVVLAPLFSAWGFALGAWMPEFAAVGVAAATWLLTVVLAGFLARAGKRGPAEWLLRRLAYGRGRAIAPPSPVGKDA